MTAVLDRPAVPASPASALVCRNCSARYPLGAQHACLECFGPLEIGYDPAALAGVSRADIIAGPHSIWRYAGLLPVGQDPLTRVDSSTGMTPLIRADRLSDELGFTAPVWIKDDSANPTHSFKDRVVSVAITAARELGFRPHRMRVDGESRELGVGPRGPYRHAVDHLHPGRPRTGEGHPDRRLRRHLGYRRLLRRRQPTVASYQSWTSSSRRHS